MHNRIAKIVGGLLVGLFLWFSTVACEPEQELPSETIAKDEVFHGGQGYVGEKPNLLVLAASNDVENPGLGIQFPPEMAAQLRSLDYERFFAVLVLQGLQGSTEHSVTVQQVRRRGNQVIIKVKFVEPVPGALVGWAVTSPFHLIAIPKQGTWGQPIRFVLMTDTNVVAETTHFVP